MLQMQVDNSANHAMEVYIAGNISAKRKISFSRGADDTAGYEWSAFSILFTYHTPTKMLTIILHYVIPIFILLFCILSYHFIRTIIMTYCEKYHDSQIMTDADGFPRAQTLFFSRRAPGGRSG